LELSNTNVLFNAEAFTKMTRAKYSVASFVFASMMRTPVAISSITVVRSPCWSCSRLAMSRYLLWNLLLK